MLTDEEVLEAAKKRYRAARDHNSKWKRRARECFDYYAGRQWSDEEKERLESTGRAAVVLNRIRPRIDAVVGMEIGNRQELRYSPREEADQELTDLVNLASEWTRDQSETEDHETAQFRDLTKCGMGWTETVMSYEDHLDGIASTEHRDPLAYDWDPSARQSNLADAKFVFYTQDIDLEDFKAMGFSESDAFQSALNVHELWELKVQPHDAEDAKYYPNEVPMSADQQLSRGRKRVRIVDYQYIRKEKVWRVLTPSGAMRLMEPENAEEFRRKFQSETGRTVRFKKFEGRLLEATSDTVGELVLPYVEQSMNRCYRAFISGQTVLEHTECPCPYSFTHHCMTAWRDDNQRLWFGMVDGLIDPQDWANKFFSQAIYIYTVNPKGGMIAKKRAFDNPSDVEDNYSAPDAITWARDDANLGEDIQFLKPGQYPSDLDKLIAFAIDSLPALDGLTPEAMGQVGRDQPGILEKMRKQAAMTVLACLFDARRLYHKRQGRTLLHYISQFFTPAQLSRITGEDLPDDLLSTLRAVDVRNYDVVVDDAPSSPNQKEFNLAVLESVIHQAPNIAPALAPAFIRNSPLTKDVQEEVLEAIGPLLSPESTPQFQQMSQQVQKLQAENTALKSKQAVEMMKITSKGADTVARLDQQDAEHDDKIELERAKMRQEFEQFMLELRQERELKMEELDAQVEIAKTDNNGAASNG